MSELEQYEKVFGGNPGTSYGGDSIDYPGTSGGASDFEENISAFVFTQGADKYFEVGGFDDADSDNEEPAETPEKQHEANEESAEKHETNEETHEVKETVIAPPVDGGDDCLCDFRPVTVNSPELHVLDGGDDCLCTQIERDEHSREENDLCVTKKELF